MNKIIKIKQNYFFLKPSGTREALLERPQGFLAVLVLFVGRRYYLRPIIPWNARSASGTAIASGTRKALMERTKRHTLTLKCVNFVNFVNFL